MARRLLLAGLLLTSCVVDGAARRCGDDELDNAAVTFVGWSTTRREYLFQKDLDLCVWVDAHDPARRRGRKAELKIVDVFDVNGTFERAFLYDQHAEAVDYLMKLPLDEVPEAFLPYRQVKLGTDKDLDAYLAKGRFEQRSPSTIDPNRGLCRLELAQVVTDPERPHNPRTLQLLGVPTRTLTGKPPWPILLWSSPLTYGGDVSFEAYWEPLDKPQAAKREPTVFIIIKARGWEKGPKRADKLVVLGRGGTEIRSKLLNRCVFE